MKPQHKLPVMELDPHAEVPFSESPITAHMAHLSAIDELEGGFGDLLSMQPPDFSSWEHDGGAHVLAALSDEMPPPPKAKNELPTKVSSTIKSALGKAAMAQLQSKLMSVFTTSKQSHNIEERQATQRLNTGNSHTEAHGEKPFDGNAWVTKHVKMMPGASWSYDGQSAPPEHQGEVLRALMARAKSEHETIYGLNARKADKVFKSILSVVRHACGDVVDDTGLVMRLLNAGYEWLIFRNEAAWSQGTFGQDYVDEMLASGRASKLLDKWSVVDKSVDAQATVDLLLRSGKIATVLVALKALPDTVVISDDAVSQAIMDNPYGALDQLRAGRLDFADGMVMFETFRRVGLLSIAFNYLPSSCQVSIDDIEHCLKNNEISLDTVLHSRSHVVDLDTVGGVRDLISRFNTVIQDIGAHDDVVQAAYFWDCVARDVLSTGDLKKFTRLGDVEYDYILDHLREKLLSMAKRGDASAVWGLFAAASDGVMTRFNAELGPSLVRLNEEYEKRLREIQDRNSSRQAQRDAELMYFHAGNVRLDVCDADAKLSGDEIYRQFERDHCVKHAPRLAVQLTDLSRTNLIMIAEENYGLGTGASEDQLSRTLTEHEALTEYDAALSGLSETNEIARSLRENLTFIGEKEYQEAVGGIATYWKRLLDANQDLQIYVHKGALSSDSYIKSDEYMFDRIIEHFSDQELEKYKHRLIVRAEDIVSDAPDRLRAFLLDDWTISGSQLREAATGFLVDHPDSLGCLEVMLIAASRERISLGLEDIRGPYIGDRREMNISVPVKSYFLAHHAPLMEHESSRGVHITGSHSAVDYGFEVLLNKMMGGRKDKMLPPPANIIRPYRRRGYTHKNTIRLLRSRGIEVHIDDAQDIDTLGAIISKIERQAE